ncbi:hypothetical protein JK636_02220 [Clostridium sp. YIM B02515]|uniref:Uncharacterized protein n=1 Tax=Clostridium rhizosphaerae TaxID=2803861 RepID=A0ABS1T972_9CLOT|nr:hypothetical protein [Clostridium rhizosphaerae]MBL4934568.1 hypothetical protein [Clostridium rhizosphaerae]
MRYATKDNLKMSIILIVAALILFSVIYYTCAPPKITGMITSDTKIIDNRYLETKKSEGYSGEDIAVKIYNGKEQYLMVYRGPSLTECRYDMNKKDFDSLQVDKRYWFSVKLYKKNNTDSGKVERMYTENPVR